MLGIFALATIMPKILVQKLWTLKLDWDEPTPDEIAKDWTIWAKALPLLSTYSIPRRPATGKGTVISQQLHGFADASKHAYWAVIYFRTTS